MSSCLPAQTCARSSARASARSQVALPTVGYVTRCDQRCVTGRAPRGISLDDTSLCFSPPGHLRCSRASRRSARRSPPWPQRNPSRARSRRRSIRARTGEPDGPASRHRHPAATPSRGSRDHPGGRGRDHSGVGRQDQSPRARPREFQGTRHHRSARPVRRDRSGRTGGVREARQAGQHAGLVAPLLRRPARLVRDVRAARAGRVDDPQLPRAVRARVAPDRGVRARRHRNGRRR